MALNTPTVKLRRRRGLLRLVQVAWRDTRALLSEFRLPLVIFLLATVGLGLIYGELMVHAGLQRLPWFELPYIMFSFMLLASPIEIPTQWYLLIFWYAMPPIALFIVGRGVADFARLFFDRSGRRAAWQEAIVSTMRHHTIVLGVGHVGLKVTRALVEMGFEVVAVDQSFTPQEESALRDLNVPFILGDGRSAATLLAVDGFGKLTQKLVAAKVPVTSYVLGARVDRQLPGALAAQTGGAVVLDTDTLTGAEAGRQLAAAANATVVWPTAVTWPAEMTQVLPKQLPPLRGDRETVAIGSFKGKGPFKVEVTAEGQ